MLDIQRQGPIVAGLVDAAGSDSDEGHVYIQTLIAVTVTRSVPMCSCWIQDVLPTLGRAGFRGL